MDNSKNTNNMTGGTVAAEIALLRNSDNKITRYSFDDGYKKGIVIGFWFKYTKPEVIHLASTVTFSGARKDAVAYKIGMVVGYLEHEIEWRGMLESDALTLNDLLVLGLKVKEQEQQ